MNRDEIITEALNQIKIMTDSLNGYNNEIVFNGIATRIEMSLKQIEVK